MNIQDVNLKSWLATFTSVPKDLERPDPEKQPRARQAGLDLQVDVKSWDDLPRRFEPLTVLYRGKETSVQIGTHDGSGYGPNIYPEIMLYYVVREGGTFLYGGGVLVEVEKHNNPAFILCAPLQYKHLDQCGIFIPRAELYVNGGVPVLRTFFEQ